ncbi:hypothetical protein ACIOUF_02735 [Pseudomonas iridis]|uniref:Uncharacterized protein n=1 Tax=Pseudomonas iridis TaxID=2710587 RepID=A0ABW8DDH1_9PSED
MNIDEFKNTTRNQHFVSQAEQRLNSCSPDRNSKNAEIYCFDIIGKNPPTISLGEKIAIKRNLSFQDLFTLARVGDAERLNFERLFHKYERNYPAHVKSVLDWIGLARSSVKDSNDGVDLQSVDGCDFMQLMTHVKCIYSYKLMNWLRNPYKIKEVLKSFDIYLNHCIDDPGAFALYLALTEKNSAEQKYICDTYGVSSKEYAEWIRLLLLFLYAKSDEASSLDGFVEEFFIAKEFTNVVLVHVFDEDCALLTDTGVVKDSSSNGLATYMNVSKNCIISLQHTFVEGAYLDEIVRQNNLPESARKELIKTLGGSLFGRLYFNSNAMLAGYNKICVKAAASKVFSASSSVYGIELTERSYSE